MLKIKDDVDLKELEKFGFKPRYNEETGEICRYEKPLEFCFWIEKEHEKKIKIFKADKTIWLISHVNLDMKNRINILYDLIQAGLVEKV